MDAAVNTLWQWWGWLNPALWACLGFLALRERKTAAGWVVLISAALGLVWQVVFFEGSPLTAGWETDHPEGVAASYKPWGFVISNFVPATQGVLLLVAFYLAVKQPNSTPHPDADNAPSVNRNSPAPAPGGRER